MAKLSNLIKRLILWYGIKPRWKKNYHALLHWSSRRINSNSAEILEKIQNEKYSSYIHYSFVNEWSWYYYNILYFDSWQNDGHGSLYISTI